jgi:hypothetical protein
MYGDDVFVHAGKRQVASASGFCFASSQADSEVIAMVNRKAGVYVDVQVPALVAGMVDRPA